MSTLAEQVDAAAELLLAQAVECAKAMQTVNADFTTGEIIERALAKSVAVMVGDRGSEARLQDGIQMTLTRVADAILLAHAQRYGRLSS